jgi:hypothetical protein
MYCFTAANSFTCILNELILWSDISSEHPIFIKTVGQLTEKNLSQNIIDILMDINQNFSALNKSVRLLKGKMKAGSFNYYAYRKPVLVLIDNFLIHDKKVLDLMLPSVKNYGKEDKVWQELLEHITREQVFMYELFCNLKTQIG